MSNPVKDFPEENFITLVASDFHLTEEHIIDPKNPLWKRFKSKEFYFDQEFADWLRFQMSTAQHPIELVLNGDIFDFDSVTSFPEKPFYKITEFEKSRTMFSQQEKSLYKMDRIIKDHPIWFEALRVFLEVGHKVVFVVGNHDLELHHRAVQKLIMDRLSSEKDHRSRIVFCEWFYISHKDTHIEHGNQYDPYCVCENPVSPLIRVHGDLRVRIPFGDMVARYMVNPMGFLNPHNEDHYSLTFKEYFRFFFKFLIKKQPFIVWTWFYSSLIILYRSFLYRLRPPVVDALHYEERMERIAARSQAEPRVARQLLTLAAPSAVNSPLALAQVLWLDRAIFFVLIFLVSFQLMLLVDQVVRIRFYWMLIPILLLAPFFIFYSSTVKNRINGSKDASGELLRTIGLITGTNRVVFGHTHEIKHEVVGSMEHLNPGSWSPIFEDMEGTRSKTRFAYVKIIPEGENREAFLNEWKNRQEIDYFSGKVV